MDQEHKSVLTDPATQPVQRECPGCSAGYPIYDTIHHDYESPVMPCVRLTGTDCQ